MKKSYRYNLAIAIFGILVCLLILPTNAAALNIHLFYNTSFVDTGTEGANFMSTINSLGHTVTTFTEYNDAAFLTAIASSDLIAFPEMEMGNLYSSLATSTQTILADYVFGGGSILQANTYPANENLPNGLFGWSLTTISTTIGPTYLQPEAAGTSFAGGPASLPGLLAVQGITLSSLPGSAVSMYDDDIDTAVFCASYGSGKYAYLGYDWLSGVNSDWTIVTGNDINCLAPVPEPATMLLLGSGLFVLAGLGRRKFMKR